MKRKTFILSLSALAASPVLSITSPVVVSGASARQYANAKIIVRAHNSCSPTMLTQLLQVDAEVATELNAMLLNRGVITAAGSDGVALAMKPTNINCVPTQALKSTNMSQTVADMRDQVRAFVQDSADTPANADPGTALMDHVPDRKIASADTAK